MPNASVRPTDEVEAMLNRFGNMLYRVCLVMLGNIHDAEDAVQDTALRYMLKAPAFQNEEHEKAWLLKVASNRCRDMRRFWFRHPQVGPEQLPAGKSDPEKNEVIEALMALDEKVKIVMLLHYVEGYRVEEIADIIGKSASAVKMRLSKGRMLLKEIYRKEYE